MSSDHQVGVLSTSELPEHDHSSAGEGSLLNPATCFSPTFAAYVNSLVTAGLTLSSAVTNTHNNAAEVVKNSATYVPVKTIAFGAVYSGKVRVLFDLETGTAGRQVDAEIVYTPLGGSPSVLQGGFTEATGSYVTQAYYEWTLPGGLAVGDILEVWGQYDSLSAGIYVKNFKIQWTWQISSIGASILVTPLPLTSTTALTLTDTL